VKSQSLWKASKSFNHWRVVRLQHNISSIACERTEPIRS